MSNLLSDKQVEFIQNSTKKINIAHGSVRTGKTVGSLFRFMLAVDMCPDSQIWMIGHTVMTIYDNAIRLLLEAGQADNPLTTFLPFVTWHPGKRHLTFKDKTISTLGAKDAGAIGPIQGKTFSLCYADEITLYPEALIDMIDTRLSKPHSQLFASCNPSHPRHKIKEWIDKAEAGDPQYYSLHFTLEDNPYVDENYKYRLRNSLSGVFYKRNYLGLWCLAEGAIFDFFDRKIHVVQRPPAAADYWIASIDYGTVNPFACLLIGVNTGMYTQTGKKLWVEKEYYWDPKQTERQKVNSEFADDVRDFLEPYGVKNIYIDPSAEAFQLELRRRGMHPVHANNDVENGIQVMTSEMKSGNIVICAECTNLIKEIETYVWDPKRAERGEDAPVKQADHACFSAGTEIQTENGPVNIEQIKIGNRVLTRNGFQNVTNILSHESECFAFSLSGQSILCTKDHPFFTINEGWKKAEDLIQSDILLTFNSHYLWENTESRKPLNLTEESTGGIRTLQQNLNDATLKTTEDISIETFGNCTTEKYQKDFIYITSTKTHLTMIYPIWNVSLQKNMHEDIQKIIRIVLQKNAEAMLQNGTDQKKENFGTLNTQKKRNLENGNLKNTTASNATLLTHPQNALAQDFVQITVSLHGEEKLVLMMSVETASIAIKNLNPTNIKNSDFVHVSVPKNSVGIKKVYNLSVENDEEYFANGLLVHNCDALRYALMTHKVITYDPYKKPENRHSPRDQFGRPRNF